MAPHSLARRIALAVIPFAALWILAAALQWHNGAYRAEFAGYPDESGHYVTGLLIRDYIAAGLPGSPMAFARNFYVHYPRVAFGHWPPVFHAVLAGWTLLFSVERASVMLLMAAIAAGVSWLVFRFLDVREGRIAASIFSSLFLLLPLVQQYTSEVMAETLIALLCFAATLVYARYLQTETWRDAAWFGVLASAAILTKPNGWLLGIVPPLALLLTRRFYLLRRASFWLPAMIVLPPCLAWYVATYRWAHHGWRGTDVRRMLSHTLVTNGMSTLQIAGAGFLTLALLGLAVKVGPYFRRKAVEPEWACVAALWIAVLVFHSFIAPVGESRHMITSVPSMLLLASAAFRWAGGRAAAFGMAPGLRAAAVVLLLAIFSAKNLSFPTKPERGYSELAGRLCAESQFEGSAFLIQDADDTGGEGALVAEVAMRDRRPDHFVIRDSKWIPNGGDLLSELERLPVRIVVVVPHREPSRLQAVLEGAPGRVQLFWSGGDGIRAYRLLGASPGKPGKFRLDLRDSFDDIIESGS